MDKEKDLSKAQRELSQLVPCCNLLANVLFYKDVDYLAQIINVTLLSVSHHVHLPCFWPSTNDYFIFCSVYNSCHTDSQVYSVSQETPGHVLTCLYLQISTGNTDVNFTESFVFV